MDTPDTLDVDIYLVLHDEMFEKNKALTGLEVHERLALQPDTITTTIRRIKSLKFVEEERDGVLYPRYRLRGSKNFVLKTLYAETKRHIA